MVKEFRSWMMLVVIMSLAVLASRCDGQEVGIEKEAALKGKVVSRQKWPIVRRELEDGTVRWTYRTKHLRRDTLVFMDSIKYGDEKRLAWFIEQIAKPPRPPKKPGEAVCPYLKRIGNIHRYSMVYGADKLPGCRRK